MIGLIGIGIALVAWGALFASSPVMCYLGSACIAAGSLPSRASQGGIRAAVATLAVGMLAGLAIQFSVGKLSPLISKGFLILALAALTLSLVNKSRQMRAATLGSS